MKFFVSLLLIMLLSFAAGLFLPWWSIAIVAFVVILVIPMHPGKAFLSGFLAILIFWSLLSFLISANNDHILAHKVSLLILKLDSPFLLMLATGLIGALVAGFAALTASFARRPEL